MSPSQTQEILEKAEVEQDPSSQISAPLSTTIIVPIDGVSLPDVLQSRMKETRMTVSKMVRAAHGITSSPMSKRKRSSCDRLVLGKVKNPSFLNLELYVKALGGRLCIEWNCSTSPLNAVE